MCSTQLESNNNTSGVVGSHPKLQRSFLHREGGWYVEADKKLIGPFADKAEAQMALMYYKIRTCWPSAKQLREYARNGF
jgi:hypothetical protein